MEGLHGSLPDALGLDGAAGLGDQVLEQVDLLGRNVAARGARLGGGQELVGFADADPLRVGRVVHGRGRIALGVLLGGALGEALLAAGLLAEGLDEFRSGLLGLDGRQRELLGRQVVEEGEIDGGLLLGGGLGLGHGGLRAGGVLGGGGDFGGGGVGLASHDGTPVERR